MAWEHRPAESPSTMKISDCALSLVVQSASLPGSVDLVSTVFLRTSSRAFLAASAALQADTALPRIWFRVVVSISKASVTPCIPPWLHKTSHCCFIRQDIAFTPQLATQQTGHGGFI
jgi:hypothetical protein